jgi:NADH:ubiquinone oxidoreductase subunit 6 (subunit J)
VIFLVALFSVLTVAAALVAVMLSDMRRVIVAAWVAGMSAGALFLAYGAEYLAIVQWLTCTLVAVSFLMYATLFGGYASLDARPKRQKIFDAIPAAAVAISLFVILIVAVAGKNTSLAGPAPDLTAIGESLTGKHVISLELLGFLLLAVLIGAGVVARAEGAEEIEIEGARE